MNFLAIDIFAHRPTLHINGASSFKTHLGVFISYCIIGMYISSFYFFGKDLILAENPNIIYSENTLTTFNEPIKIDYLSNNFQVAFGAYENSKIVPIDPRYFKIYSVLIYYNRQPNGAFLRMVESVDMGPCINFNFDDNKKIRDYLNPLNITNLHCFKRNENYEAKGPTKFIQGALGNANYSYLAVNIAKCVNSTDATANSVICASAEEIEKKSSTIIFGGLYVNYFVDANSYTNAKDSAVEWFSRAPIKAFTPAVKMKFQKGRIVTDQGWIFNEESSEEFVSLKESQEIASSLSTDNITLVRFDLQSYMSECTFLRRYRKVQEVFASVGGVMKLIVTLISIVMQFYVKVKFEFDIVRLLCDINKKEIKSSPNESTISFHNFVLQKAGIFHFIFKSNKEEWRKYNMAVRKIKNKMDFVKILRKSVEVDLMKKTLFPSKNQLLLFYYNCSNVFWEFFREEKRKTQNELSHLSPSPTGTVIQCIKCSKPSFLKREISLNFIEKANESEENIVKRPEEILEEQPQIPRHLVSERKHFISVSCEKIEE